MIIFLVLYLSLFKIAQGLYELIFLVIGIKFFYCCENESLVSVFYFLLHKGVVI